jgi:hypothetical protein
MRKISMVQFDFIGVNSYKRLLDVFIYSIQKHMPDVSIEIIHCEPPQKVGNRNTGLITNTAKLARWVESMERCEDGDEIIFADCDLLAIGDMFECFDLYDFDLAYTVRHGAEHGKTKIPINGGVLPVRVNERTKHFMREYLRINNEMYMNPEFHSPWRLKAAGMNQSAFLYLLETNDLCGCKHLAIPCERWNICNTEWGIANLNTAACLHIKSALRRACLGQTPSNGVMNKFVSLWQKYERDSKK